MEGHSEPEPGGGTAESALALSVDRALATGVKERALERQRVL